MPDRDDTATTRLKRVIERHEEDWRADYERITGEPYNLRGWLLRLHPDDVVPAIRELHRGALVGRIDVVYRMRDAAGQYARVRGAVRLMFGRWVGVIYCLGRTDCATPSAICRILVRSVRNSLAPFVMIPFLELLIR